MGGTAGRSRRVIATWGFFFFQAEAGIRDYKVTGVQTCALPIYGVSAPADHIIPRGPMEGICAGADQCREAVRWQLKYGADVIKFMVSGGVLSLTDPRSEERRVGKECRSRWSPDH